jgi:hypothetical protein
MPPGRLPATLLHGRVRIDRDLGARDNLTSMASTTSTTRAPTTRSTAPTSTTAGTTGTSAPSRSTVEP